MLQRSAFVKLTSIALFTLSAFMGCGNTPAQSKAAATTSYNVPEGLEAKLSQNLERAKVNARIKKIVPTGIAGVYWVSLDGMAPFYALADGEHVLQGDMIQLTEKGAVDAKEQFFKDIAAKALKNVKSEDTIDFKPTGTPKASLYVFTDVDCGFCQKLHSEMPQLLAEGLEIKYLAWPRSPQSEPAMEAVWCSANRQDAITMAKQHVPVDPKKCDSPVKAQMALGHELGVSGTPAIFTADGRQIGGYLPPKELLNAALKQ